MKISSLSAVGTTVAVLVGSAVFEKVEASPFRVRPHAAAVLLGVGVGVTTTTTTTAAADSVKGGGTTGGIHGVIDEGKIVTSTTTGPGRLEERRRGGSVLHGVAWSHGSGGVDNVGQVDEGEDDPIDLLAAELEAGGGQGHKASDTAAEAHHHPYLRSLFGSGGGGSGGGDGGSGGGSSNTCSNTDRRIRDVIQVNQPYPSIGVTVDGSTDDWDLSTTGDDYVGGMTADGGSNPFTGGKLYLRWNCADKMLCALVKAESNYCLTGSDNWFKDFASGVGAVTPLSPGIKNVMDFKNKIVGWEGCFSVQDGCHTGSPGSSYGDAGVKFNAMFRPYSSNTGSGSSCSSGSGGGGNCIGLDLRCPCVGQPTGTQCTLPSPHAQQQQSNFQSQSQSQSHPPPPPPSGTCCGNVCTPTPPNQSCFCPRTCTAAIVCPANTTIECGSSTLPAATGTATVTETGSCASAVYDVTSTDANPTPEEVCPLRILRTWTAQLKCSSSSPVGKTLTCVQEIDVQDSQAPVLGNLPDNETLECQEPAVANVTGFDDCQGSITPILTMSNTTGCGNTKNVTRTWSVSDSCSNSATESRLTWIRDTTAPTLHDVPDSVTASCDAVPAKAENVTATDLCNPSVNLTYFEANNTVEGDCQAGAKITRTWLATDDCGNAASQSQVIELTDLVPPNFTTSPPADAEISCDAELPTFGDLFAVDSCGSANVTKTEFNTTGNCTQNITVTRSWTATDLCSNSVNASQTITIYDTTKPTLSGDVESTTVSCDAIPDAPAVQAHDNCASVTAILTVVNSTTADQCQDKATITRTWTAADPCFNTADPLVQVITLTDLVPPNFTTSPPADAEISCDAELPTFGDLFAVDSCGSANVTKIEVNTTGKCAQNITVVRNWTASDSCGNEDWVAQTIHVYDTTAPVLSRVPASITMECGASATPTGRLLTVESAGVSVQDNCDESVVVHQEEVSTVVEGQCKNGTTINRTWTSSDHCGNTVSESQIITFTDTTAPTLENVPSNQTVECSAIPYPATVTGSDLCGGDVSVSMVETSNPGDLCSNGSITRVWTGLDVCHNAANYTQILTIQDTTAPTLTCPANKSVACDACTDASVSCLGLPSIGDNCDSAPTYTHTDSYDPATLPVYSTYDINQTLTRIFTGTDRCGNTNTCAQRVTKIGVLSEVKVKRTVNGACDSSSDFTFDLYQGSNLLASNSTKGRRDGILFDVFLNPSLTYTICERNVGPGWSCKGTANGGPLAAYNPDAGKSQNMGNVCFDIQPTNCSGVLTIVVDHTRSGGCPRSPDYWKNWNYCTGSSRCGTTRSNGGPSRGYYIMEDFLPLPIYNDWNGDRKSLSCSACGPGVQVLSTKTLTTCSSYANQLLSNDLVANLAKSLFAAQLNVKAKACLPSSVATTITNAEKLLDSLGYVGCKLSAAPSSTQTASLLSYATTLDDYNNGKACPGCWGVEGHSDGHGGGHS